MLAGLALAGLGCAKPAAAPASPPGGAPVVAVPAAPPAAPSTGHAQPAAKPPAPRPTSETVEFTTCARAKDSPTEEELELGDGLVRCALASGLVAQQDGSACFDVNRLLDSQGNSLFSSEMDAPKGTVFVPDQAYVIHRCQGSAYAVVQAGRLFPEGIGKATACHKKKLLRRTYLVQDVRNGRRYDDLSAEQSQRLLAQLGAATDCATTVSPSGAGVR